MPLGDIISSLIWLLAYSGPLLPMILALCFRPALTRRLHQVWAQRNEGERLRRDLWLLLILLALQGLCFWPFAWAALTKKSDSIYSLYYPFLSGGLMFLGTSTYVASELVRLRRQIKDQAQTK